jgi:hypothetical protein
VALTGKQLQRSLSLDGFRTWFDYEFFFLKLVIAAVAVFWIGQFVLDLLYDTVSTSTGRAFALVGMSVVVLLASVWWAGRYR